MILMHNSIFVDIWQYWYARCDQPSIQPVQGSPRPDCWIQHLLATGIQDRGSGQRPLTDQRQHTRKPCPKGKQYKFCYHFYALSLKGSNCLLLEERCTVNAVNFAGLIFRVWQHKNIRGLLNSRWADAHLTFLYCTNTWHHTTIHLQATRQHKHKAGPHILQYITYLHQHTWLIHNSYMSKMCIQNIANIFAGFWIRDCWILREIREN